MSVSTNMVPEGELGSGSTASSRGRGAPAAWGCFLSLAAWLLWPDRSCPRTWLLMFSGSGSPWAVSA